MIHEFQLKWKTYLLLYYAIPSVQRVQISGEGSALSFLPHSELHFHIPFLCWRMWHISISLFSLIRICWLNINEINPSWWHWIRLLFEYACIRSAHWLQSRSHTFVSTNVPALFSFFPTSGCFSAPRLQKYVLNYISLLSVPFFFFFALGVHLLLTPACGCLECPPLPHPHHCIPPAGSES